MKRGAAQHSKFYEQLGANIRKYREQRKLSQNDLAKLVSLTRTSLTNIEKGRQHPPVHTVCELVEQLKVNISELLPLPSPAPTEEPGDITELVRPKVRAEDELMFIEKVIKGGTSHDDTKKQNSGAGGKSSG